MAGPKVLITTSGLGSRLGDLTQYTNKSLVRLGNKPALSYILEGYPNSSRFVITLGHKGDLVRQFVGIAHPDLDVTFVEVENYAGQGSSLIHSMLCAKDLLQEPFIFHAGDTVILEVCNSTNSNWVCVADVEGLGSSQYRTVRCAGSKLTRMLDKGEPNNDGGYVGVAGIRDYQHFWQRAEEIKSAKVSDASDVHAISLMLQAGTEFEVVRIADWYDIGNINSLENSRLRFREHFCNLDKVDQAVFLFDNYVVKFFADPQEVSHRVKRAKTLNGSVPELENHSTNFFRYSRASGDLLTDAAQPHEMKAFLGWCKKNLWQECREDTKDLQDLCRRFYRDKTYSRVEDFLTNTGIIDQAALINGRLVPSAKDLLRRVDWGLLYEGIPTRTFHGDLHFSNILRQSPTEYRLIDWRSDFGGSTVLGDVYYDLAKLNHGMIISHDLIDSEQYSIQVDSGRVSYEFQRHHRIVKCQQEFQTFVETNYDWNKVTTLTALIFLNIAPLHHYPYSLLLYYLGRDLLYT